MIARTKERKGSMPNFVYDATPGVKANEYRMSDDVELSGSPEGATLLPYVSACGGVSGSSNPFGQIVAGNVITGSQIGEPLVPMHERQAVGKGSRKKASRPKQAAVKVPAETEELLDILDKDIQEIDDVITKSTAKAANIGVDLQSIDLYAIPNNDIRLKISHSRFGTFKGTYKHLVQTDKFLVVFYDVKSAGYEPPIILFGDDEPMTLKWITRK
jgi:hypothetical protein